MEEACGLPHLTHLFPFDLCSYYIYFGLHFQQHGAIKDFKTKRINNQRIISFLETSCIQLFFVELMRKAGEGSFMAGRPIRKNLHQQCIVIAVTGYRHDMLKVTAGFSL